MVNAQSLYDQSPIAVQHLLVSLAGLRNNPSRYGREYWTHRRWLQEFDKWSIDRKLSHENAELTRFVRRAAIHSPFYRQLYDGLDVESADFPAELGRLPVVDKEMLRAAGDSVHTVPRRHAVEGHTGGTTGKSLVVLFTAEDMMRRMAMLDHFKSRVGFEHRKMRRATFNGKHIVPPRESVKSFWRYNAACRQMIYSSFHLAEANLTHYVDSLNRFKPHSIDGFFTSIVELAGYIERSGRRLDFRPLAIFPTAETVTDAGREVLERVFGCRVYNQYASSEGAPFVTECVSGSLHIEHASGVFEDAGDEVLVTSFTTHGTPLIRYRIGDSMHFSDSMECDCGMVSRLVCSISGRSSDFLYRADGAKVHGGNVANLFKNLPNSVVRSQLIQNRLGEVEILLQVDEGKYTKYDESVLREEFVHKFGVGTNLTLRYVPEIPREASGKHRLIKNNVSF